MRRLSQGLQRDEKAVSLGRIGEKCGRSAQGVKKCFIKLQNRIQFQQNTYVPPQNGQGPKLKNLKKDY